jgi:hypothetical protein
MREREVSAIVYVWSIGLSILIKTFSHVSIIANPNVASNLILSGLISLALYTRTGRPELTHCQPHIQRRIPGGGGDLY